MTARVLRTVAGGYVLDPAGIRLDSQEFERAFANGSARLAEGDAETAVSELRAADALWRDVPLADLSEFGFVRRESARLTNTRLEALELCAEAELALGRDAAIIGELEQLAAAHPDRERLTAVLMTALYRSGRQADALAAYRRTRISLVDRLGVEPGPAGAAAPARAGPRP